MTTYDNILTTDHYWNRYVSHEAYILEPSSCHDAAVLSENVVIARETGAIRRNVPAQPTSAQESALTAYGLLGTVRLYSGEYLGVITQRQRVARLLDRHDVFRVVEVRWLPIAPSLAHLSAEQAAREDELLSSLDAVFRQDAFFFSYSLDLTNALARQPNLLHNTPSTTPPLYQRVDPRFYWNRFMQRRFIEMSVRDNDQNMAAFILPVISGFVEAKQSLVKNTPVTFVLIARRLALRNGTRYFSRGIDDKGNVSNFVETEQLLIANNVVYSHVQIRGSIPLYWRQVVNVKYQPLLEVVPATNQIDMARRHFDQLKKIYGDVLVWNLVNKKGYELVVGDAMTSLLTQLNDPNITYTHFDFHHECRKMQFHRVSNLLSQYAAELDRQQYTVIDASGRILVQQTSVVRTNCMDCLDRTNVVQSELAKWVLERQLKQVGCVTNEKLESCGEIYSIFKNVWADHADAISLMYSGTGALKTDFTRTGKRTIQGALQDFQNSIVRYIKNNFLDGPRQDAIDMILGNYEISPMRPIPPRNPQRTSRFTILLSLLAVSFIMLVLTLTLRLGASMMESTMYLAFWMCVLALVVQLIIRVGYEFVNLPTLVDPYPFEYITTIGNGSKKGRLPNPVTDKNK